MYRWRWWTVLKYFLLDQKQKSQLMLPTRHYLVLAVSLLRKACAILQAVIRWPVRWHRCGQSMSNLRWSRGHWDMIFSEYLCFLWSVLMLHIYSYNTEVLFSFFFATERTSVTIPSSTFQVSSSYKDACLPQIREAVLLLAHVSNVTKM
jgi:hypothetical protein